jgi:hypothetical protein
MNWGMLCPPINGGSTTLSVTEKANWRAVMDSTCASELRKSTVNIAHFRRCDGRTVMNVTAPEVWGGCPSRVIRVGLTMSAPCPVYPR